MRFLLCWLILSIRVRSGLGKWGDVLVKLQSAVFVLMLLCSSMLYSCGNDNPVEPKPVELHRAQKLNFRIKVLKASITSKEQQLEMKRKKKDGLVRRDYKIPQGQPLAGAVVDAIVGSDDIAEYKRLEREIPRIETELEKLRLELSKTIKDFSYWPLITRTWGETKTQ